MLNTVSFRASGALKQLNYGNGRRLTMGYNDQRSQPTSMIVDRTNNSADKVIDYAYQYYDANGKNNNRIRQITDNIETAYSTSYTYDNYNRLTNATANAFSRNYQYDEWGNVKNFSGLTLNYATNGSGAPSTNRLLSDSQGGSYSYDAAGNQTAGAGQSYSYDGANRLKEVGTTGANVYGYDGDGKRVKKTEGGATTYYIYSSKLGQSVMEVSANSVQRAFVYNGNKLVAMQATDGQFYWLHTNHLGNSRAMTDGSGNLTYKGQFDPYGASLTEWSSSGNTNLNNKKFTGYERDTSGLDYANARMYAASLARFTIPDPLSVKSAKYDRPQTLNRYTYSDNDPVNKYDPSGLLTIIIPGTFSSGSWGARGTPFWNAVKGTFGEDPVLYDWLAPLIATTVTGNSIISAAQDLAARIIAYNFKPGEKLNIIAHSHGGNVAKLLTNFTQIKAIDVLITMGTPHRPDFKMNMSKVYNYFNVYSKYDVLQKAGGFIPGSGGRTDKCAINIGVDRAPGLGKVSHGDLHSPEVWREMNAWLSRARLSVFARGANGSLNRDGGCGKGAWGNVGGVISSTDNENEGENGGETGDNNVEPFAN